jgi:hypothetical protein
MSFAGGRPVVACVAAVGARAPGACVDAAIDCPWRAWCEAGACVDAGDAYCRPCVDSADCDGGDTCWADAWCGPACGEGGACPAGFACADVEVEDGSLRAVCLSACWLMVDAEG